MTPLRNTYFLSGDDPPAVAGDRVGDTDNRLGGVIPLLDDRGSGLPCFRTVLSCCPSPLSTALGLLTGSLFPSAVVLVLLVNASSADCFSACRFALSYSIN